MLKAYVGVASQQGLSIFQPEREDTLSLVRQCVRRELRRFAFWAIVNDAEARSIQAHFSRWALSRGANCPQPLRHPLRSDSTRRHRSLPPSLTLFRKETP